MKPTTRRLQHSSAYFLQILETAAQEDETRFRAGVKKLKRKTVDVIIEARKDERFFLVANTDHTLEIKPSHPETADIQLRISPGWFRKILEGEETPVEAFFFGHLRAKGITRDLYCLHAFFIDLAEIAVKSPRVQRLVAAFHRAKESH
jgi:putative sterol carrier protein